MSEPANRDGSGRDGRTGRFLPGNKANPSGRPATPKEVAEFFQAHTIEAAQKVVQVMRSSDDLQDQLRAAMHVLDRSLGKPSQAIDVTARAEPAGLAGNPDAARARLEALIAAEEAKPAISDGCESADNQTSAAALLPSPTENGASADSERALSTRLPGEDGTP